MRISDRHRKHFLELSNKKLLPNKFKHWHDNLKICSNKIKNVLCMIKSYIQIFKDYLSSKLNMIKYLIFCCGSPDVLCLSEHLMNNNNELFVI